GRTPRMTDLVMDIRCQYDIAVTYKKADVQPGWRGGRRNIAIQSVRKQFIKIGNDRILFIRIEILRFIYDSLRSKPSWGRPFKQFCGTPIVSGLLRVGIAQLRFLNKVF